MTGGWRQAAALPALVAIAAAALAAWLTRDSLLDLLRSTGGTGPLGVVAILGIYVAIALAALPVSWFTAVVGYLFGGLTAILLSSVGTTGGAAVAFLLGRHVFAPRVAAWIAKRPRMEALAREIGRRGFQAVALARLSPASPFGVLTYAASVMPVRFGAFLLGTFVGKLPGNVFYALLGAGARSLHAAASGESPVQVWQWTLLGAGIAATGVLVWMLTRAVLGAGPPGVNGSARSRSSRPGD